MGGQLARREDGFAMEREPVRIRLVDAKRARVQLALRVGLRRPIYFNRAGARARGGDDLGRGDRARRGPHARDLLYSRGRHDRRGCAEDDARAMTLSAWALVPGLVIIVLERATQ